MIREVELVSYLPEFIKEYKEPVATLEAEDPEFALVWKAADRVLQNEFIETADEYGISRWEAILGIVPQVTSTLAARKRTILTKINEQLPFTIKSLENFLKTFYGRKGYRLEIKPMEYLLMVQVYLSAINDVDQLLKRIVPANIIIQLDVLYNTHEILHEFRHEELANYTYYQLRNEVLTNGNENLEL